MGEISPRLRRTLLACAPFVGASALTWIVVPIGSTVNWVQYAGSSVLALVAGSITFLAMRGPVRHGVVVGGLLFLAADGLLRNSAGGIGSSATAIAIIPVFQAALYSRSRRDLVVILGGMLLLYAVPIVAVGGAAYPATQYRAGLLVVTVSAIIGWATQTLVARVRAQADHARQREHMLERVNETVHALLDSPSPRDDVCEAARSISDAGIALIYEPTSEGELVCTAMAGLDPGPPRIVAAPASAVLDAFEGGVPILLEAGGSERVGSLELWDGAGRPTSLLYEPLQRAGKVLGVLVVGWFNQARTDGSRATVVALLAHEAAAVIARADELDNLAGEAQTDPLTGLPNRRAWDAALARALASGAPVAVAMFDLDRFKQFNDTFGHPAGDRLLKAIAAGWRDQLRGGDLLARLGGEEFGLLLIDCDPTVAHDVVERLRGHIPERRTCSAGVAIRAAGEPADELVARADAALYAAKSGGRDQTQVSALAAL